MPHFLSRSTYDGYNITGAERIDSGLSAGANLRHFLDTNFGRVHFLTRFDRPPGDCRARHGTAAVSYVTLFSWSPFGG